MIKINNTSEQQYAYAKLLLMGSAGSGKTYQIGTLPESETLILNVLQESGLFTLRKKKFDVVNVATISDFENVIAFLKTDDAKKYKYVAIDSYSQFQKSLAAQLERQGFSGFKLWGLVKDATKRIVDEFKLLPYHVIFTSEVKADKDEELGTFVYQPALSGTSKDDLPYWLDEVYFLTKRGKAGEMPTHHMLTAAGSKYPCKSRANCLPVMIDNPNLSEIIKKLIAK